MPSLVLALLLGLSVPSSRACDSDANAAIPSAAAQSSSAPTATAPIATPATAAAPTATTARASVSRVGALSPHVPSPSGSNAAAPHASAATRSAASTQASAPIAAPRVAEDAQRELVRIDGAPIALAAYEDYLWTVHGASLLDEFVHRELVERAAAHVGIAVDAALVDADFEPFWQRTLAQNPGGEKAVLALLEEQGKTLADLRRQHRAVRRLERLEDALCQRTRVIDDTALRARFEREYGKDGIKVELAHVFLHRAGMRAELAKQGIPAAELTLGRIDAELASRARALLQRLGAGEDFAALVRKETHDEGTRDKGGVIDGYNYDRYGDELARAVRAAQVGVPFGPVQGAAGVHIGLVRSRVETKLNDVRDELLRRIAQDPASPKERMELRQKLLSEAKVERGPAAGG